VIAAPAVEGVLVTHGRLGAELVHTAESILGPQAGLTVVTNSGKAPEVLQRELEALVADRGPAIVFVDLLGGSCGHVCTLVGRAHPEVLVVSGVNLPMVLEFLCHRGKVPLAELRERVLDRGAGGIRGLGWESGARA
jgi:PTS system mannose-specific IIA component